jgi:hypothetical protein
MKQRSTPVSQIIGLKLDLDLPFEALILNRLQRVPKARKKEWLLSLLVQGFKCECAALRTAQYVGEAGDDAPSRKISSALDDAASTVRHINRRASAPRSQGLQRTASKQNERADVVSIAALRDMIA